VVWIGVHVVCHVSNSARVKTEAVINVVKERCIKEMTPIPTIYEEDRAKLRSADYMDTNPDHDDVISELPTFYEKRMSLYRSVLTVAGHNETIHFQ
jgi:hypothetical protein